MASKYVDIIGETSKAVSVQLLKYRIFKEELNKAYDRCSKTSMASALLMAVVPVG